ncbi:MAG: serine phosphatase RsbU (regulator of sigma subunit) [Salibacteraceae bacterium]
MPKVHFRLLKESEVPSEKGVFNKTHILNEYKGDRQPVGRYIDEKPFTSTTIQTQKGEHIFIFSDGYADQFGGANSRKFKYGPFKKLLSEVMKEPNSKQKQILDELFEKWRNDLEQVDDVCVIGVMI